jgi:hypothetical protein
MANQTRRIAFCHLLLRGNRWMPVSVNRELGPNDRCSPDGAVISALLCAVVEGDAIVGWTENSGFTVGEVGEDGSLAPLDFRPTALAFHARDYDTKAAAAGVVGISSLIAKRRVRDHNTGNLDCAKQHSSAPRYKYLTGFKVILLWEFCLLTSNTNETSGQRTSALPKEFRRRLARLWQERHRLQCPNT